MLDHRQPIESLEPRLKALHSACYLTRMQRYKGIKTISNFFTFCDISKLGEQLAITGINPESLFSGAKCRVEPIS